MSKRVLPSTGTPEEPDQRFNRPIAANVLECEKVGGDECLCNEVKDLRPFSEARRNIFTSSRRETRLKHEVQMTDELLLMEDGWT